MADLQPIQLTPATTTLSSNDVLVGQSNSSGQVLAVPYSDIVPFAWTSYTPTWTAGSNPSIGNGTITGRYVQIGKIVILTVSVAFGSTTAFGGGDWAFSVPVPAKTTVKYVLGSAWGLDTGVNYYGAVAKLVTAANVVSMHMSAASGSAWTNINPFTWGSTDEMAFTVTYEAA